MLDSVTLLGAAGARGRAVLCASHAGAYAALYAARHGVSAVVLHDAGVGRERAGVSGLDALDALGVPGAAVSHRSARIGDGAGMLASGVLSHANEAARALGVAEGMAARAALARLDAAGLPPAPEPPAMAEARREVAPGVHALDSNGLVGPEDAGRVVVTGSHGALLGGRPGTACKAAVRAGVYNDAGADAPGLTRLPALDARGIPSLAVSCFSARIGEGLSTWEDGWVSAANDTARALGCRVGDHCRAAVALILRGIA